MVAAVDFEISTPGKLTQAERMRSRFTVENDRRARDFQKWCQAQRDPGKDVERTKLPPGHSSQGGSGATACRDQTPVATPSCSRGVNCAKNLRFGGPSPATGSEESVGTVVARIPTDPLTRTITCNTCAALVPVSKLASTLTIARARVRVRVSGGAGGRERAAR